MQWFPDIFTLLKEWGVLAVISILVLYGVVRWFFRHMGGEIDTVKEAIVAVKEMRHAISDPAVVNGIIRRSELKELTESIKKEISSKCGAANCPIVPIVKSEIAAIHSELLAFEKEAVRVREETRDTILAIFNDNKDFHNELGREMIKAIQRMAEWKKRNEVDS